MIKLLLFALLAVLLIAGARRRPENLPLPAGLRLLFVTGTEFLFVGVLLGPLALGVLDEERLSALKPITAVGMGFVGLHYGLQLEAKLLRWIPLFYHVAPLAQAMGGALFAFVPSYFLFAYLFGAGTETTVAALVLAAAAACSTPEPLDLLARDSRFAGASLLTMLRHLAEMGELPALLLYGIAVCYRHDSGLVVGWTLLPTLQWLLLTLLLGVVFGLVLDVLPAVGRGGTGRLVVGGLGAILFFTGFARYLLISPLFVSLIAGLLVINVPGPSRRLRRFVANTETPFRLFLLLVAGASWSLEAQRPLTTPIILLLAFALMASRILGKVSAGWVLAKTTHAPRDPTPIFGIGLVAQGGISAAIALDYLDEGVGPATQLVVTMILLSVIVTELIAPWLILHIVSPRESVPPGQQDEIAETLPLEPNP